MFLYKYRPIDKWTLTGLSEKTIHFKSPFYFNDPFDSRINFIGHGDDKEWADFQQRKGYTDKEIAEFKDFFSLVDQNKDSLDIEDTGCRVYLIIAISALVRSTGGNTFVNGINHTTFKASFHFSIT